MSVNAADFIRGDKSGFFQRFDALDKVVEELKRKEKDGGKRKNDLTKAERASEREMVVTRSFNTPARIVFTAWTTPELLKRCWAPKSLGITLVSCEADVRTGGLYRFVFAHPASEKSIAFFGRSLKVMPTSRLVWTNEEGGEGGAVTTVTFEEKGGATYKASRSSPAA